MEFGDAEGPRFQIGPALVAFGIVWFLSILCWPAVTAVGLIVHAIRGFTPAKGATSAVVAGQAA